jgi:hypothetical protein
MKAAPLIGFERMIVAAGARDLALAFPGWDRPGVMGAQGFGAAVTLYDAFAGRRITVLGGGAAALQVVRQAQAAGIEIAAVISAAPTVDSELIATGVEILAGSAIRGVLGAMEVEGVIVAPLAAPLAGGPARRFACDSIVSAIDVAPTVEMFDLLNCATVFDRARGGYVPVIDAEQRCTLPGIYAAGDCAGVSDASLLDPAWARAEGIRAARSAARDAGLAAPDDKSPSRAEGPARDSWRREWLSAHAGHQSPELIICRCEEVTLHDLLGVRPPRYLNYDEKNFEARDLQPRPGWPGQSGSDQAPDPRRHGPLPGPPLSRTSAGAAGDAGQSAAFQHPAAQLPRAVAPDPPIRAVCGG